MSISCTILGGRETCLGWDTGNELGWQFFGSVWKDDLDIGVT